MGSPAVRCHLGTCVGFALFQVHAGCQREWLEQNDRRLEKSLPSPACFPDQFICAGTKITP